MTPISDIPISSITWLLGSAALLILGARSLRSYRRSRTELLKYTTRFALLMGVALSFFSLPSLFTLNTAVLLQWDLTGEVIYYASMVAQAGMVWLLVLRRYVSIYVITVPVALLCLAAWINALMRATLVLNHNFLDYLDPRFSTFVLGGLLLVLFLPVGVYFLRLAPRQQGLKSILNSVIFGLTYIGTGLIAGTIEVVTGKVITPATAPGLAIFFVALIVIGLWPRRTTAAPAIS